MPEFTMIRAFRRAPRDPAGLERAARSARA